MNKFLLTAVCLGTACLLTTTAFSECVCGKQGCKPCDSMEDYLDDVSDKIHKDNKMIEKTFKHNPVKEMSNKDCHPKLFFLEQVALLSESGQLIEYYEQLTEDDTLSLTDAQKETAKKDAKALIDTGKKVKQNIAEQKKNCPEAILFENDSVWQAMPMKKGEHHRKHKAMSADKGAKGEYFYEILEDNAGNVIAVGEALQEQAK